MRVSENWLREWVDPAATSAELVEQLTMAGLEVDGVAPAAPDFSRVVVGQVLEVMPHPDAERLRVCRVNVGAPALLNIVCGAPNARTGLRAPVALEGAVLPGNTVIRAAPLRGVDSQGMLCSARELGLSDDAAGLMELPGDSPPGVDLRTLLALEDRVIDIDLTPNRGDCLGMAGVAREVGVLYRCDVRPPPGEPVAPALDATFPVELAAPADCPRYAGRVVRGVDPNAPTPLWMTERLRRAGLRSLGPLIDVTNYVMLELGQPMHAFDLARLEGGIVVRRARPDERLELLNGIEVTLEADVLVIADHARAVAMAGIMGGEGSGCTDATRDVFLESAFFSPTSISGRARRYGLHTDSSPRFERGVDPALQVRAIERATRLLVDIAGGEPGPVTDVTAREQLPAEQAIRLRPERINRLLGVALDPGSVEEILIRLGMAVAKEGDHWLVVPPSFRFDITIEADLIEELGRIHGYTRLPSNRPLARLAIPPAPEGRVALERVRETLVQRGYHEAITYSFVDPASQAVLDPERTPIVLANPIASDLAVMRTTLWPGLLKVLAHNRARQQPRVRLFETGLAFLEGEGEAHQPSRLAGAVWGDVLPEQWGESRRGADFFDLKGDVEAVLGLSGEPDAFAFEAATHPALQPGQSARIRRGENDVGWLGTLHPRVARELGLDDGTLVFELELDQVLDARRPRFAELSRFPAIRRDLAIVVDEDISAEAAAGCIRAQGGELLREVWLFDLYRGPGIPEGHKSLAFGLILQDFYSTLTDTEVDGIITRIVTGLERELGATLRV